MNSDSKITPDINQAPLDELTVETIDFPYEMTSPKFGDQASDIDGTVLYLNTLEADADNMVVLKGTNDLVHLFSDTDSIDSGVVDANLEAASNTPELMGFHYYVFPDNLIVFSESALIVMS